jgi:hypothetical protein
LRSFVEEKAGALHVCAPARVVTYNAAAWLPTRLENLLASTLYARGELEIVIVLVE